MATFFCVHASQRGISSSWFLEPGHPFQIIKPCDGFQLSKHNWKLADTSCKTASWSPVEKHLAS